MNKTSRFTQKLLNLAGKEYTPDPNLSFGLVFNEISNRAIMLLRGLLLFRNMIFVGKAVKVRCKRKLYVGRLATIRSGVEIDAYSKDGVTIGTRTCIGKNTMIRTTAHLSVLGKGFKIGKDSGTGEYCYFGCAGGVIIGDDVIMGMYVTFHSQEHIFSSSTIPIRLQGTTQKGISIGSDCWIGARVTFLDGSVIRPHSVIAAGAVVKGDFPAGAVIGGVPARLIKVREGYENY